MRKGVSGIPIKQIVMAAFLMGKRLFSCSEDLLQVKKVTARKDHSLLLRSVV